LTSNQQKDILKIINDMKLNRYSQKTIHQYHFYLTHFLNKTKKDCTQLTKDDTTQALAEFSTGLSGTAIKHTSLRGLYSCLNTFFKTNNRNDLLLDRSRIKGTVDQKIKILNYEERQLLFNKAKEKYGIMGQALFETSYWQGFRVDDLINLKVKDVDYVKNTITIQAGKGNKAATIDLIPRSKQILEEYMNSEQFDKQQTYLFEYTYKKGKNAGKKTKYYMLKIEKMFQEIVFDLNMSRHITFHILRHSIASHLLASLGEKAITRIQKHLRHTSPVTTLRYLHSLEEGFKDSELEKIGGA
jgi:integrase